MWDLRMGREVATQQVGTITADPTGGKIFCNDLCTPHQTNTCVVQTTLVQGSAIPVDGDGVFLVIVKHLWAKHHPDGMCWWPATWG